MADTDGRDHLFVSFATPEWALAEWLTLRLTAEGYRVWCERFGCLGGELFPRNVADALRRRTNRVLALFSHAALREPTPTRERALALGLAEERGRDFVIPLSVEVLPPQAVTWLTSESAVISFDKSWTTGLSRLLARLQRLGVPRSLLDGPRIAAEARRSLQTRRSWHTVL